MPTAGSSSPSPRPLRAPRPASTVAGDAVADPGTQEAVVIDCDRCLVRGDACTDCIVSCLLGPPPPEGRLLDDDQVQAIDALSASGLVPPLRLVTALDGHVGSGS